MNKKINLVKILKDCPKGTKLYSTVYGEVKFNHIEIDSEYPIRVTVLSKQGLYYNILLTKYGTLLNDYPNGECILFPSKDQRDWSKFTAPWYKKNRKEKFDPKTLKSFDKVLIKNQLTHRWICDMYSYLELYDGKIYNFICTGGFKFAFCIPYNNDTKHLVGTKNEAPEYYRYWED